MVQRTSRKIKGKRSETSRGRQSQKMKSRKIFKQKKNMKSCKIPSAIEELYSRA